MIQPRKLLFSILNHELFKKGGVYLLGNLINKSIPFLMIPVMTRFLTPEGYGQVSSFQALYGIALALISVSINSSIGLYYFKLNRKDLRTFIFNSVVISFLFFILFTVMISFIGTLNLPFIPFSVKWLQVLGLYVFANNIVELLLALFRAQKRALSFIKLEILRTVLNFSISIYAIVLLGMDWQGRLVGIIAAAFIACLISITILIKENWMSFNLSKDFMIKVLAYGAPLIPHVLARWSMGSIDRFFINQYSGLKETGLYSLGDQISLIIGILVMSFHNAWLPFFFESLNKKDTLLNKKIVRFSYVYIVVVIMMAIGLTILSPFLLDLIATQEYAGAQNYIFVLSLGYAFSGMYYIFSGYLFYTKKTSAIAICTLSGAFLNILLNYILVPEIGAMGAAYSTLLAYMLIFFGAWFFSARHYSMPWNLFKH